MAEFLVEAHPLCLGDEVMAIGPTTGCVTFRVDDMRVDFQNVEEAPKGVRCSVALHEGNRTGDTAEAFRQGAGVPKLRRGDKVFLWVES